MRQAIVDLNLLVARLLQQRPFENVLVPKKQKRPGFFQQLSLALQPAAGAGIGGFLGGAPGAAIGGRLGSAFGDAFY